MKKQHILSIIFIITLILFSVSIFIKNNLRFNQNIGSGIYGKATISPACAGPQREGKVCSKPYQGLISIKNQSNLKEVVKFNTDINGEFKVNLSTGSYILENGSNNFYPKLNQQVVVKQGEFTRIDLDLDTGMR